MNKKSILTNRLPVFLLSILFLSGCGQIHALKTLKSLGDDNKLKEKELIEETNNFYNLKKLIEKGLIPHGLSKEEILKLTGKPVIQRARTNGDEEWAYKSPRKTWFEGKTIYLYFRQGKLVNLKCPVCNTKKKGAE